MSAPRLSGAARLGDGAIGAAAIVIVVTLLILAETGVFGALLNPAGSRTVTAEFADARQLPRGAPVRISGVDVGTVTAIALHPGAAQVTMKLHGGAGPLYANAGAQIRYRTLLGGSFYVDLTRGSRGRGSLTGAIPTSRTGTQVELDDIAGVFRGAARTGMQQIPGQLAAALADSTYPGRSFSALATQSPALTAGLNAARGELPSDVGTLIGSADRTVRALDAPTGELRGLVSGTAATLEATADRSADLEQTIATAPGLLTRVSRVSRSLNASLRVVDPLLVRLMASAPAVAPTARALRATARPAAALLARAVPLLRSLRPAASSLAAASRVTVPLLADVSPSLSELQDRILPYAAEIQPDTKHSLAEMIGPGMAGLGAMGAYEDSDGHFARFPITLGSQSLYLPCQVDFNPSQAQQLLACESLSQALGNVFGGGQSSSAGAARSGAKR